MSQTFIIIIIIIIIIIRPRCLPFKRRFSH